MASEFERVLCVKNEIFVFRIPPRQSNRGYRAADWKLDAPDWTGRMRIITMGKELIIKLEDKNSGELFAECPVKEFPGVAVEAVLDSSRYFVLRIVDGSGRSAFIGIGFTDRADSFDLNVSIQDHFKWLRQEDEIEKAPSTKFDSGPKLDLGFKEGQTITLSLGNWKEGVSKPRPKPQMGGTPGLLPPPPAGGVKIAPPPSLTSASSSTSSPKHRNTNNNQTQQLISEPASSSPAPAPAPAPSINNQMTQNTTITATSQKIQSNDVNMLIDIGSNSGGMNSMPAPLKPMNGSSQAQQVPDLFGEFKTAESTAASNTQSDPWLQF